MSPLNKKKLNQLRIKLDKIDNSLLNLIKERSILVNHYQVYQALFLSD